MGRLSRPRRWADKPTLADVVLWGTIAGGLAVVLIGSIALPRTGAWAELVPFMILAILADRLGVDLIESRHQKLSFSFSIAVMLLAASVNPPLAPLSWRLGPSTSTSIPMRIPTNAKCASASW